MPAKVVNVTNASSSTLVISTGNSAEPALAVGETREVLVGIPSRPESFIDGLVTAGLITKAAGSGALTTALSNSEISLDTDNMTYLPENLHDMTAIAEYRGADRKEFFDDEVGVVKISDRTIDTTEEVTEAGVDLDQEDQDEPGVGAQESVLAALTDQGITYTAANAGLSAEDVTITLVDPGVAQATTLFTVDGADITVSLRNTSGGAIDATADDVITDFASAPTAVSALVSLSGSGVATMTALATTNLAGATVEGDYSATVMNLTLDISGQNADYANLTAQHTDVDIPESIGDSTTSGDVVLTRTADGYELLFTDGTSSETALFSSLDPVNDSWEFVEASGTDAEALTISSVAVAV